MNRRRRTQPSRPPPETWRPFSRHRNCLFHVTLSLVTVQLVVSDLADARVIPPVSRSDSVITNTVDYLQQFGYLPSSSVHSSNLRTEDELREAIKSMQRFAGLEPTGEVDEATKGLMKRKRCGMKDLLGVQADRVRRYALQGQRWNHNFLTWSVGKPVYGLIRPDVVSRQVAKALSVWSSAANLTFREVNSLNADIMVSFRKRYHEDGYPFDGQGSVLAHAFFPGEGIGGDAHFDADEKWTTGEPKDDGVNFFSVAAHEFGHSLGLSHSSVQGSLMFPYYQHITDSYQLHYDDQYGIQQLYGPRNVSRWGQMVPTIVTRPPVRVPSVKPDDKVPDKPTTPDTPQACRTNIDAISTIRREIFIFKGEYFWRRDDQGYKSSSNPVRIRRFWHELPSDFKQLDAVYEHQMKNRILFFSGNRYWVFNANKMFDGYPRPLTDLGLPADLKKLDAAMIWGHNGKTYFFSGNQYWRYDEKMEKVEPDYPRDMIIWKGVPTHLDSAFQNKDGVTYFFKGHSFWKFDDNRMQVSADSPQLIAEKWFDCPSAGIPVSPPSVSPRNDPYSSGLPLRPTRTWTFSLVTLTLIWLLCL